MDEIITQGLKGLIAAGPLAVFLFACLKYQTNKVEKLTEDNTNLKVSIKEQTDGRLSDKDKCTIELMKANKDASVDKMGLYERVLSVLEHLGGEKK